LRAVSLRIYDPDPMVWLRRINLERTGAGVVVALTLVTLLMVGASALMRIASDDIYSSVATARGITDAAPRTDYGRWLAAQLSADVPQGNLDAQHTRADELAFRSDRVRELGAVPAVVGLVIALLTDSPETAAERRRGANPSAASVPSGTNGAT
jgi:hypothetical protein